MRFDRLRLVGFKSFADPLDLEFHPGLTGIIGPNGCGKSNLTEALRWVMGESSARTLRADAMDAVIFGGAAQRPARDATEVTLAFTRGEESFELTRRLARGDGSAWRLNGREARQADVRLLFADAATGAHAAALVGQGRVAALIAARPLERRHILEEAAGIAGLAVRRREAETRLKAAAANLERGHDLLAGLDHQASALGRQARAAERYIAASARIRVAEARLLYHRWRAAGASAEAARAAERDAAAAVDAAGIALAQAQSARHAALAAREAADARAAEAERAADVAAAEAARAAQAHAADERRRADLARAIATLEADRARELARLAEAEAQLARLAAAADTPASPTLEAVAAADAALTRAAAALVAAETALAPALDARANAAAAAAATRAQAAAADAALAAAERDLARHAAPKSVAAAPPPPAPPSTLPARAAEAEAAEAALREADLARDTAEAARAEAAAAHAALGPTIAVARATLAALTAERDAARGRAPAGAAVLGRVTARPGHEAALAATLGDDLEAPAGAPGEGWARVIAGTDPPLPPGASPLTEAVHAPPELSRRLAQIGVVADAAAGAALAPLLAPGQRLVSPAGELWRWDGFDLAQPSHGRAAERLRAANRLAALNAALPAAGRDAAEAEAAVAAASDKLDAATRTARAATEARAHAAAAASRAAAAVAAARAEDDRAARRAAEAETAARESDRAALAQAAARDRAAAAVASARAARATCPAPDEATLAAAEADAAAARAALAAARAGRDRAAAHASDLRRRLDDTIAARSRADAETEAADGRRVETRAHADECARRLGPLHAEHAAIGPPSDHQPANDGRQHANAARERANAARAADQATAAEREQSAAAATLAERREARAAAAADTRHAAERAAAAAAAAAGRFDAPAEKFPEIHGFDPAPSPTAPIEVERARATAERERLGAVNLRAGVELAEIEARRAAAAAEHGEIAHAIARLRGQIGALNRDGRARLAATFAEVDQRFASLFTTLFGGGEAALELVESDDPLGGGLEILARPPGKARQTLAALSGGEQALTAIALIFALFLTQPSPICVLDEVDAPLDDANVERFCALLDHVAAQTQTRFLVVTHNPVTMSRLDRLWGVTMAEAGVSQLVEVDLAAAAALVA